MTEAWFKQLLGYAIYPGLLMAFLTLMLSTYGVAFYGENILDKATQTAIFNFQKQMTISDNGAGACTSPPLTMEDVYTFCGLDGVKASIFCGMLGSIADQGICDLTGCSTSSTTLSDLFIGTMDIGLFDVPVLHTSIVNNFLGSVTKLFFFSLFFYLLNGSVVGFMSGLLGVAGFEGQAVLSKVGSWFGSGIIGIVTGGVSKIAGKVGTATGDLAAKIKGG